MGRTPSAGGRPTSSPERSPISAAGARASWTTSPVPACRSCWQTARSCRASGAGGFGNVVSRQAFADDPPDLIRANVQAAAERYGLVVESVRVVHALTARPDV